MHDLIRAWRSARMDGPPYVLPGDERLLEHQRPLVLRSREEVLRHPDFDFSGDGRIHLGLLPVPFAGDLARADIFILLLNPGFKPADYFTEFGNSEFRAALRTNLKQPSRAPAYPLFYLNPQFADSGGYRYWREKLARLLAMAQQKHDQKLKDVLRTFSRRIAILELFPYHSSVAGLSRAMLRSLRSVELMHAFVHDVLVPRARAGDALLIVTRKAAEWGLKSHRNVVVYGAMEARSAHLTPASAGGRAIARRLGL